MLHRFLLTKGVLCALLVLATACGTRPSTPVESQSQPVTLSETDIAGVVDPQAIEAAYAQRLQLGLGSPYRLVERALADERLGKSRVAVARGLLTQIEQGRLYEITPLTLVAAGVPAASAIAQLELIEQAIESTPDARVGELAVKLGYELAAAEQTVPSELVGRVARVVALLRDKQLAMRDVQRLRDVAGRLGMTPENLVPMWRREHVFAVEQPTLAPLNPAGQEEAARLALLLVGGIRSAVTPVASALQRTVPAATAQLNADLVAELARDTTPVRTQNALVVTLRAIRAGAQDTRSRLNEDHWQRFFERAISEETFVAELATVRRSDADDVIMAGITLDAAIAMRPFAQDPVRLAQTYSVQDLQTRFGVRVTFDTRVSEINRAHSLRVLTQSLEDLRSIIRTIDLAGLTFRIAPLESDASHLAYHEPRKRVIYLDPATTAGTIAHEVAHDLDWQLAARKYRTRSHYATDYATRNGRTLAYAVQNLVADAAPMNKPSADDPGGRRPAEIFARRFEWYVASALAQRGRSNGYLSSAQDDWIAGYGAAVRPDPSPTAAKSFATILADATNMDRADVALVERIVMESAPAAVRVLSLAPRAEDAATFVSLSLADVDQWECGSAWRAGSLVGTNATRWYVQALRDALFPPAVAAAFAPAVDATSALRPRRNILDVVRPNSVRGGSCVSLVGAVLAEP